MHFLGAVLSVLILPSMLAACGSEPMAPREQPVAERPSQPAPSPAPTPAPAPAPTCDATITEAAKRITTESKRVALDTTVERTSAVMIASCETEQWPATVMTCIAAARLDADLDACTEELTYRQHKRLHAKIAAVAPKPAPAPRPAARPTSIARGRDLMEPGVGSAGKLDCTSRVVDPTSAACRKQYCRSKPADVRCDALE